ncbi:hypothetical protein [Alteribacillus bidgolensis]|uniref:Uncharacterized protein n=1 Tax=Alteribacillus bidgolensis TaxID=930129 RepID=A0A1G8NNP2_9BACI|nr:hypothetical protein [Alteribacillus bidgolensis]SDI81737.1 hypothetical protein SAMN05216352_11294 [Alteribacillus bidgolensis]
MNSKARGYWIPIFIIIGFLIGGLLLNNVNVVIPIIIGVVISLLLLELIKRKMNKSDTPPVDERVFHNIKNYMLSAIVFAFILLFFLLVIFQYYFGNDYIHINYLFLYFLLTIMTVGIAGLVGKSKNN